MPERLVESLEACPMVKRGDYDYFLHLITDGGPEVDPAPRADIADICVAIRRGDAEVGRPVKSLVEVEVVGGKVRILGRSL